MHKIDLIDQIYTPTAKVTSVLLLITHKQTFAESFA